MCPGFQPASVYRQNVSVRFEYPVVFCSDSLSPADEHLSWAISHREPARRHRLVVCVDEGVLQAWPSLEDAIVTYCGAHAAQLELRADPIPVPGGEACKNSPSVAEGLLAAFADARLDRHACVVAIGGGAVLDAVGYATALVHRGLRLVRLPTTVLAQNDAGIGVKNGVNGFGAKNFLGTFAPPFAVVNDGSFLSTLPERDVRAGLAEAVKVACIRDGSFFEWLEQNASELGRTGPQLNHAIRRCAELHLRHISSSGDAFEMGSARPLDYGHWAAHKLEVLSDHDLRHGEAVAIGMLLDARYAERRHLLSEQELGRLQRLLAALGLPLHHPTLQRRDASGQLEVLGGLEDFREHLGGQLTVTLLDGLGKGVEVHEMDSQGVAEAIDWLGRQAEAARPSSIG